MKICRECKYHTAGECAHPDLRDVVTGQPSDCHTNRLTFLPVEAKPDAWCGPQGVLWLAAAPQTPATGGG